MFALSHAYEIWFNKVAYIYNLCYNERIDICRSGGSGAFFVGSVMKLKIFRLTYIIPLIILTGVVSLLGYESLSGRSVQSSGSQPVALLSRGESVGGAYERPSATPTPTVSPSPASPSPRVTAAASKGENVLSIPLIGLNAAIVNVGLTPDNAIDVPPGLEVGYWTGSALPGTPGAAFLDGHVDGIFAHLHKLTSGQQFSVTYAKKTYYYQVVHTETVALAGIDMEKALSPYGTAAEGLNIMTCAGTYLPSIDTYDQRFVVYAVRIG